MNKYFRKLIYLIENIRIVKYFKKNILHITPIELDAITYNSLDNVNKDKCK